MKDRNFLLKAWDFAASLATHPVKTVRNVAAGIKEEPTFTAHKVVSTLSLTFGTVALGVGALNLDPLLIGTGFVFAGLGGNALASRGAEVRTEAHAEKSDASDAPAETKQAAEDVPEEKLDTGPKELSIKEKAAILVPDEADGGSKGGFRPDLSRFRKDAGSVPGMDGGP